MDTAVETIEHAGLTITIHYDADNSNNPRDWDNLGHMVCWHRGYDLGDETISTEGYSIHDDIIDDFQHAPYRNIVIPLYLYEHSGVTMRAGASNPFSCPWDSGQVGYIYTTDEKIRHMMGDTPISDDEIRTQLLGEVETYDYYLRGEVYGYVIASPDDDNLDSCWGFVGDIAYCIEAAKESADYFAQKLKDDAETEAQEADYWARRGVPTV